MMPGRAQHPTAEMLDHAHAAGDADRRGQQITDLRRQIERLGLEINDRQQQRAQAKRTLHALVHTRGAA